LPIPVLGLAITCNEEVNLPACLDEVFIVDSFSEDGTMGVCERFAAGGVRARQHEFEDYASQRNWALRELPWSREWILSVDADERVTPELQRELQDLSAEGPPTNAHAYMVKRRFYFLGHWIRRCGLYPVWLIRLFRRDSVTYRRKVNEQVVVDGAVGRLENGLIHLDGKGISAWIWKHNRYSSMEATSISDERRLSLREDLRRLGINSLGDMNDPLKRRIALKQIFRRMPCRYVWVFLYMYLMRLGFLDGLPGLYYCLLHAANQVHIAAKTYEAKLAQSEHEVKP